MVVFPNAKINLGLYITGKRPDGYHNIETVFYPIDIKDILEIIASDEPETVIFTCSGLVINTEFSDNLCVKAYHLLKKDFPSLPHIKMHLHKNIPMGAGMGGGSSDAAFTLKLLNEKFNLGITQQQLMDYALLLGSDCPFFIRNKTSFARGRGEQLEDMQLLLSSYHLLIVNPGIHVNTAAAFRQLTSLTAESGLKQNIMQPLEQWKACISNDFEHSVFSSHPEIADIKETLYKKGAMYASMSGSGSTVFGIFQHQEDFGNIFPETYFYKWV